MEQALTDIGAALGERAACSALGLHRGNTQRQRSSRAVASAVVAIDAARDTDLPVNVPEKITRQVQRYLARRAARLTRRSARALTAEQNQALLDAVHEERFVDRSVPSIYATLLDENRYHGSISTICRVLHRAGEVGERRDQATRPAHVKPELCATAPNLVYAWDITKLHGPRKWTYYYLYIVIDIYSRYVVGWLIADRESSELAKLLLATTIKQQGADPTQLTIHSDRGSSMTSKPVAFMLADLGVTKSHSRPHVSNDNPHVESLNKTVKYQPTFPTTFAKIEEARAYCVGFFASYNNDHRHSSIALLTPSDVQHGRAQERIDARQIALDTAYATHPERFVRGRPKPLQLAPASFINRPQPIVSTADKAA